MITLSDNNLYNYFQPATAQYSSTLVGKRLYDFVSRNSRHLIVTIGDSWTWGADLSQQPVPGCHLDRQPDDHYRINNVYGNCLAAALDADFLNLGESGSGNWYLVRKLRELADIRCDLDYDSITVIGVFTEAGRDFNSASDVDVDYRSWLLNNIHQSSDYYKFLKFVNEQIAQAIHDIIGNFDDRYRFVFATNFVDPIGYEVLQPWFVKHTWLQTICTNIKYQPLACYTVFPWVIEKFSAVLEMAPELDRITWLQWINELTEAANVRAQVCTHDRINFGPLLHPLAVNHRCWAEYLHRVLNESV